ncbi:MAG: 30S ribosomal protein S12 methylthiotransferase RimO [Pirellulales bacterium]|nr:30S ribosomal protein S12 methylthiotransferase RimO [Pirellulales bacterium]
MSGKGKKTCALVSLGCPKNLIDSERMLGLLHQEGYRWSSEVEGADLVVINTCGFIDSAREESDDVIRQVLDLKRAGRVGRVVVAGCYAQREPEALLAAFPEVDQILGVFAREEIVTVAGRAASDDAAERLLLTEAPIRPPADTDRFRLTPGHLAYLRIAEGCDRVCAFCSIPAIRGPYHSKPIEQVVDEARQLVVDGTRELIVVAQDTSYYGRDTDGRPRLAELLAELDQIDGLAWIRLMYLYPQHLDDRLLDVIASGRRIVPYLDLPLQHINDEVLQRMRRGLSRRQTEELLDRLRERIPSLILRTTLLAGFPGETEAQFEELVEFVRHQRFERLGVFPYRLEPGTRSAELDGHLSEEVRQQRAEVLMRTQQPIAQAWNEAQVGRTWDVLIDRDMPEEPDAYVGRTPADAPDVDGLVYVTGQNLRSGQIVPCEIVAAQEYDLIGVAVGPPK